MPDSRLSAPVDLVDGPAELAVQVAVHRRVEVAGAGAHHQSLQRGQPHRRVDRLRRPGPRPPRRRCRGAAPRGWCPRPARPSRAAARRETKRVRRAVEAVAPDPVLLAPARAVRRRCRRARGIVWWKAVSKTATCGTSGKSRSATRSPSRLAGLCRGASGTRSSTVPSRRRRRPAPARRSGRRRARRGDPPRRASSRSIAGPCASKAPSGRSEGVLEVRDAALLGVVARRRPCA